MKKENYVLTELENTRPLTMTAPDLSCAADYSSVYKDGGGGGGGGNPGATVSLARRLLAHFFSFYTTCLQGR